MFTGLVESMGLIRSVEIQGSGYEIRVQDAKVADHLSVGDSVAVNGVCLTVVSCEDHTFSFQVGPETLRLTNLGHLQNGDRVNLERAVLVGDRLGGHIVQGHVDGLGQISLRERHDSWEFVWFSCSPDLTIQMVPKGSITVDGISLTLVEVLPAGFSVALIPHTLEQTTLGFKKAGDTVNLETDLFAKYIHKYLQAIQGSPKTNAPS